MDKPSSLANFANSFPVTNLSKSVSPHTPQERFINRSPRTGHRDQLTAVHVAQALRALAGQDVGRNLDNVNQSHGRKRARVAEGQPEFSAVLDVFSVKQNVLRVKSGTWRRSSHQPDGLARRTTAEQPTEQCTGWLRPACR